MKAMYTQSTLKNEGEKLACDVCSSSELPLLFDQLVDKINSSNSTEVQGIAIQPKMRNKGYELFLGLRKNSKFGSIIIFGTSGNSGEIIKDLTVGFPPLNQVLAKQLIEKIKILQYANATQDCNFETGVIEEIIVKFSQLVIDFPEIKEIDINPLVINRGEAAVVDALITIDMTRIMREPADHHEHLVIAPYPRKYIAKRTLKSGAQVTFRPIKPEDEPRFNELFKSLSEESVRFRFFEIIKEMSHDILSRYCNLDYDREIAIVAECPNDGRIIGVVRLILDSERKNGEFAIMVGDSWHGLGLGSKLMDYIIDLAKDLKLEMIYSYVTRANIKMTSLCCKKGFEIKPVDKYTINMYMTLPC